MAVGRCRYGILLRDDGFVYDDGVVARTAADRLHVTTTTGGAPRVLGMMEDYLQTEWPHLKVWLTSTTEQWAVIAVQGPNARKLLEPLVEQADISAAALPHMAMTRGLVCGVPAMIFRVSFTGELGYEINVPADYGPAVWQAVWEAGQPHGMCAYGTEAMHVLRAEKGYIIVGQDTDGTMTPDDAGGGLGDRQEQERIRRHGLAPQAAHCRLLTASSSSACSRPTRSRCSRKAARSLPSQASGHRCG